MRNQGSEPPYGHEGSKNEIPNGQKEVRELGEAWSEATNKRVPPPSPKLRNEAEVMEVQRSLLRRGQEAPQSEAISIERSEIRPAHERSELRAGRGPKDWPKAIRAKARLATDYKLGFRGVAPHTSGL